MNNATRVHVNRVWRQKWLVLVCTVLGSALGFYLAHGAEPAYTSRVALTVGSPNRAPEQDAVLSVGYAQYFQDPAYQSKLQETEGIPDGASFAARTVASSPILYLEATAASPQTAQAAATKAGTVFRDEINAQLRAAQDAAIAAVRKPFDEVAAANGFVSEVSLTQMQDQINRINADTSNKLIDLQPASEAVRKEPSWIPALLTYGISGLLLGCLLAVAIGVGARRLRTADDVEAKADVAALAVVPAASGKDAAARDRALKQVVTAVGLAAPVTEAAVVVTAPGDSDGVRIVARAIAEERARQGVRVILVHADLRRPHGTGVGELLAGRAEIDAVLTPTRMGNLREVLPGSTGEDPFTALSKERFTRLLTLLHGRADLVVIIAPPVLDAVEAQVLAAASALTVLVFDRGVTKAGDARRAERVLAAVDAKVLGAVLISVEESTGAEPAPRAPARTPRHDDTVVTAARRTE
ncbi:hypothetical protein JK358_06655 [Nocardia sp. 2]|uniref:Polysaccharide chain length determinant N-terminal domain-containing protein n=1 Tax=Nocardia acididurans TaxID=2802282 RepID=A0ABS1M078_9NOCA|nr:Wzz/FepE/Etk N-terminal domain-containing protein [Nocardia acididurans]MBL1074072.1 hypothetical protein [Nocardia acididurans]